MKNKVLTTGLALLFSGFVYGQNPFESIGQESNILTLTDGKYPEVFENDTLQIIGDVVFNTVTNKIEYFIERDTLYSEATMEAEIVSRWLSRDPLAAQYSSMSPYNFCGNNPIYFIDSEGKALEVSAANPDVIKSFKATVKKAFAGKVYAEVAENGTVTFHQVPNTEFTALEAAAFEQLKLVEEAAETAKFNLVDHNNGGENVTTADYFSSTIDVDDVANFGNDDDKLNSKAVLVHEATEQLDKAKQIAAGKDVTTYESYENAHKAGIKAEQSATNLRRTGDEETVTYSKFDSFGKRINTLVTKTKRATKKGGTENVISKTTYKKGNLVNHSVTKDDD